MSLPELVLLPGSWHLIEHHWNSAYRQLTAFKGNERHWQPRLLDRTWCSLSVTDDGMVGYGWRNVFHLLVQASILGVSKTWGGPSPLVLPATSYLFLAFKADEARSSTGKMRCTHHQF